jgi:hypothetical protein
VMWLKAIKSFPPIPSREPSLRSKVFEARHGPAFAGGRVAFRLRHR